MEANMLTARGSCVIVLQIMIGPSMKSGQGTSDDLPYLRNKFRGDVTDRSTGLGLEALKAEAERIVASEKDREPWCLVKAHVFEMVCDRMSRTV